MTPKSANVEISQLVCNGWDRKMAPRRRKAVRMEPGSPLPPRSGYLIALRYFCSGKSTRLEPHQVAFLYQSVGINALRRNSALYSGLIGV